MLTSSTATNGKIHHSSTLKIHQATEAALRLITGFHQPGLDRGCIASFGNTLAINCDFATDLPPLIAATRNLAHDSTNERTRFYDSLADMANFFWLGGRRNVPWLLIAITDGIDCESKLFERNPAACGSFLHRRFSRPSNHLSIVGVGNEGEINRRDLKTLAQAANCQAVTLAGFELLEELFLRIAVQVTTNLAGVRHAVGNLSWVELVKLRNVYRVPLDWAILTDRSQSMFKQG